MSMGQSEIGSQSRPESANIVIDEVFTRADRDDAAVHAAVCIDDCNAACYIPGAPDGAQVTAFYKKSTPSS